MHKPNTLLCFCGIDIKIKWHHSKTRDLIPIFIKVRKSNFIKDILYFDVIYRKVSGEGLPYLQLFSVFLYAPFFLKDAKTAKSIFIF